MSRLVSCSFALLASLHLLACGEDDPAGGRPDSGPDDSGIDVDDIGTIDVIGDADSDASGPPDAGSDAETDTDAAGDVADAADSAPDAAVDVNDGGADADAADASDAQADADTGEEPEELEPEVTVCPRSESFDPAACEVVPGESAGTLIIGQVLVPDGVLVDGEVLIDADGLIACVGCDCASGAPAGVTEIVCPAAVVSPGLINAHDHITYTQNDPGAWGDERFDHRHDWNDGLRGHTRVDVAGRATRAQVQWGELRQLIAGTTSMAGAGSAPGIVRNLDAADAALEGLPPVDIESSTFPLDDGIGIFRTDDCSYPGLPTTDELDRDCWLAHVAEGIDREARNEFLCMSSAERGGVDMLASSSALVHGIALTALDARRLADSGTGVVWSPRSNLSLYGNTAPILLYKALGVEVGIGTDWTASGSMNLLRELQCATEFSENHLAGALDAYDLWRMATVDNARLLGVDDIIGTLEPGRAADIALFVLADIDDPWSAVTTAEPGGVLLVMRAGEALFGDPDLIAGLRDPAACESFDGTICGEPRLLCLDSAAATSLATLQAANVDIYDLFFCGTPTNEPTCQPFRPGEYENVAADDRDGDGIDNADDLCADVFDPIRPVDDGVQPDYDEDGIGDACDRCPLGGAGTSCAVLPTDDRDLDGVADATDNCPATPNADQANRDTDGEGDVCDLCPDVANEFGWACPVAISAIKRGEIARDARVTIDGVVTAVDGDSFWLQTADDERGDSPEYGAIFVFVEDDAAFGTYVPTIGDHLQLDGAVTVFRTFYELEAIRRFSRLGTGVVTPTVVDVAELNASAASRAAWDAVLVTVPDAEIVNLAPTATGSQEDPAGEYGILGNALIDELLYAITPSPLLGSVYRITGIVRTPNGQLKFAPRSADDVALVGTGTPRLLPIAAGERFVAVDEISATYPDGFELRFDRAAPTDYFVTVTVDDPSVVFAANTVVVPEGQSAVELVLTGLTAGETLVTVSDGRNVRSATVTVYDALAPRSIVSVAPNPVQLNLGRALELEVLLDAPAGPTGAQVAVSYSGGTATLDVDALLAVPARALRADLLVTATATGATELLLELDGSTQRVAVEVLDAIPVRPPTPDNDIIITEVMPKSVDGTGDRGEWFEIYNNSAEVLDLSGCEIRDNAGGYTIPAATVDPGKWAVLAASNDPTVNGGVDPLVVYGTALVFNNGGDEVILQCDGVVIDRIEFTTSTWATTGQSYQLKDNPVLLTTAANDVAANWCRATTAYGTGVFRGTPGAASDCR